jgi:hydroxymethylbilane synthase
LKTRVRALLAPGQFLPAPGQGALGIEILTARNDAASRVALLNDTETAHCVKAERAFSRALGGSCRTPLGAYACVEEGQLWLRGFVASVDGQQMAADELRGHPDADEALGRQLADRLRTQGAEDILASLGDQPES